EGIFVHRDRRFGRRGRSAQGAVDHARRSEGGLAGSQGYFSGNCGEGGRWHAVLRLGGGRRGRALREDGAQRNRVWRHAVDFGGVSFHEGGFGNDGGRNAADVRGVEQDGVGFVPDRDHVEYSGLQGHGRAAAGGQDT